MKKYLSIYLNSKTKSRAIRILPSMTLKRASVINIIANENVYEPIIDFLRSEGHQVLTRKMQ
jgi:antitoxin component of RelBE/YafQ-DinJ toxin-antitoxin module